ncbi:hypothetical protein [Halorubrum sp. F4]|uniref:hypothetical protein n=1 Tax=Halorubrum sp. F4 TaxID=2989715 RepID=UPI0024813A9F|nr:hypothetical protein [Halorubrum sp. F4]
MDRTADGETGGDPQPGDHIDQIVNRNTPSIDDSREVEIDRTDEWGAIGAVLFLTPDELEKQGINPETTDKVVVRVQDGFLLIDAK